MRMALCMCVALLIVKCTSFKLYVKYCLVDAVHIIKVIEHDRKQRASSLAFINSTSFNITS